MLLVTSVVPLVLNNPTHFIPTRVAESICQISTIVLSISSTTLTAVDGLVSTSYSIFPISNHLSQATGFPTAILQPNAAATPSSLSGSSLPRIQDHSSLGSSGAVYFRPTSTSTLRITESSRFLATSWSTSRSSADSSLPTQTGSDAPANTLDSPVVVPQSRTSTTLQQVSTTASSSISLTASTANPVYTCPRDNGMYYSDTNNRVYQLVCGTDERDSTIETNHQSQLQSCVDACGDVVGCIGVSYTATSGLCAYKSSIIDQVASSISDSAILANYICPGADATRLVDSSGSVFEILCNTFFPTSSNITSSLAASDLASCSEICSDNEACSGFTFQNGSCTLVSNRNSNDGVLRMDVATAILIAKRIAQVVSSNVAPYRSTSLVGSLPVDVSRTLTSTIQDPTATSTGTVKSSAGIATATSSIIIFSSPDAASSTNPIADTTSSPPSLPGTTELAIAHSSNTVRDQTANSLSVPVQATADVPVSSSSSIVSTLIVSETRSSSTRALSSMLASSSTLLSTRSLASDNVPTTIRRSSQISTALSSSSFLSVTGTFSLSAISRTSSSSTSTTLLQSVPSSTATKSDSSVSFHPTLATSQTSSVLVDTSSSERFSSSNTVFSNVNGISISTATTASYPIVSSSLPPETNYSCPAVNGDQVQANTGGSYTIGCDQETTEYYVLVAFAPDFNGCMTFCDQTPGCTAWTWSGSCNLKTGTSASDFSFRPSTRGAVSGIRTVPAGASSLPPSGVAGSITSSSTSTAQFTGSVDSTNDEPGVSSTASSLPSQNLPTTVNEPTIAASDGTSVQSSGSATSSTTYRSSTTRSLSSGVNTVSDSNLDNTATATITDDLGSIPESTSSDNTPTTTNYSSSSMSSPISSAFSSSMQVSSISAATLLSTHDNGTPTSFSHSSPSTTCSVFDNVLDICLDAMITPSVGVGGGISAGVGSSTITVLVTSASVGIAPSFAASAGIGISVGTDGLEAGASASANVSPDIPHSSRPFSSTSVPSASCSVGGNALNLCIDAAVTPSVGIGGSAGVGLGIGSSTLSLVGVPVSLAVAPSVVAGVDAELSTGTSGIGLIASATVGADLNLSVSGTITAGIPPYIPTPTSSANCSAGGNVVNLCVDAAVAASASAGMNLNLGPSSSALTLLDASVALAPSAAAGLDLGLSTGSSGLGLAPSATLGLNLGLSVDVNLGGNGRSTASTSTSARSSTVTVTTVITLLPTSVGLNSAFGLGSGQSPSLAPSVVSSTRSAGLSSVSSTITSSLSATRRASSTSTISGQASGLALTLPNGLARQVSHTGSASVGRQGFITLVRGGRH